MILENTHGVLSHDDITRFESESSVQLPPEYRQFLLKNNGGRPVPGWYSMNGDYEDEISYFLAINASDRHSDLAKQLSNYRDWILPYYLPFAVCGGGDVLCLSLKSDDPGAVYHWNHALANAAGEPSDHNMTRLTNSLSGFLEGVATLEEFEAVVLDGDDALRQVEAKPWWKFW